jgi:hypothetical protein
MEWIRCGRAFLASSRTRSREATVSAFETKGVLSVASLSPRISSPIDMAVEEDFFLDAKTAMQGVHPCS